jgi:hypothetical protein
MRTRKMSTVGQNLPKRSRDSLGRVLYRNGQHTFIESQNGCLLVDFRVLDVTSVCVSTARALMGWQTIEL